MCQKQTIINKKLKFFMCKFIKAFCLTIALSVGVFAQTTTDEYNKNEFFVGYSNQQVDRGDYTTHHGFEGSYVRNISRYFGIKGDVSGAYKDDTFEFRTINGTTTTTFRAKSRNSLYNFLGGVQIKDNASEARFKPFGHASPVSRAPETQRKVPAATSFRRILQSPRRVSRQLSAAVWTSRSTTVSIFAPFRLITIRFAISDNLVITSASASG